MPGNLVEIVFDSPILLRIRHIILFTELTAGSRSFSGVAGIAYKTIGENKTKKKNRTEMCMHATAPPPVVVCFRLHYGNFVGKSVYLK